MEGGGGMEEALSSQILIEVVFLGRKVRVIKCCVSLIVWCLICTVHVESVFFYCN